MKLRCFSVQSWLTFAIIILIATILHNDHFIDLLLFNCMSFHGLEHFVLIRVIHQSLIASQHLTALWFLIFARRLWTTEITSTFAIRDVIFDNLLLFIVFGCRIFDC